MQFSHNELFYQKLEYLILNKFNINLYGPNGCGKTFFLQNFVENMKQNNVLFCPLVFKLSDFHNMDNVYKKFNSFFVDYFFNQADKSGNGKGSKQKKRKNMDEIIETINIILDKGIKKFYEIYEILSDLSGAGITFDNFYIFIDSIDNYNSFLNYNKILNKICALGANFNFKLFLVSSFNLMDLKVFNLNIQLEEFTFLNFPVKSIEEIKEMLKIELYYFNSENANFRPELVDEVITYSVNNFRSSMINLNDYLYYTRELLNEFGLTCVNFIRASQLNEKLRQCVTSHSIHYDEIKHSENGGIIRYRGQINTNKNTLTDNLSKCQKMLLTAAFIANDLHLKYDSKLLKNVRKTGIRRIKLKLRTGTLRKNDHAFTMHRLIAIYCSIYDLIYRFTDKATDQFYYNNNIDLICDINNLINLDLLKVISHQSYIKSYVDLYKKIIINYNLEYAMRVSDEIGVSLSDFIDLNNY